MKTRYLDERIANFGRISISAANTIVVYLQKIFPQLNNNTKVQEVDREPYYLLPISEEIKLRPCFPIGYQNKPGVKAKLQRILGEIMGKGQQDNLGYTPIFAQVQRPQEPRRQVEFQSYEFTEKIGVESTYIRCGYDAHLDVLYIRKIYAIAASC